MYLISIKLERQTATPANKETNHIYWNNWITPKRFWNLPPGICCKLCVCVCEGLWSECHVCECHSMSSSFDVFVCVYKRMKHTFDNLSHWFSILYEHIHISKHTNIRTRACASFDTYKFLLAYYTFWHWYTNARHETALM